MSTANITNFADGTPAPAALRVVGVNVVYPGDPEVHAVKNASFELAPGEILVLLGASGSGKSSLLRAIAGLEPVRGGSIYLAGKEVTELPVHNRNTGMVFQDGQLFPHRNVGRNIAYGLEIKHLPKAERQRIVREMLELVDLAGYEDRQINTLSGGQAQRVALARTLAAHPQLILLDEPLSALDRALRERLAHQLREIVKKVHTTAVYVTHDQGEAATVADKIAVLVDGEIAQLAAPAELRAHPATPAVADLLGVPFNGASL
ncbi:MAG: ABC transporter ATP-binding protein [Trueperella sp.]|nr:ABC transporter ATP-binding protein [Trueperella sp.]